MCGAAVLTWISINLYACICRFSTTISVMNEAFPISFDVRAIFVFVSRQPHHLFHLHYLLYKFGGIFFSSCICKVKIRQVEHVVHTRRTITYSSQKGGRQRTIKVDAFDSKQAIDRWCDWRQSMNFIRCWT